MVKHTFNGRLSGRRGFHHVERPERPALFGSLLQESLPHVVDISIQTSHDPLVVDNGVVVRNAPEWHPRGLELGCISSLFDAGPTEKDSVGWSHVIDLTRTFELGRPGWNRSALFAYLAVDQSQETDW